MESIFKPGELALVKPVEESYARARGVFNMTPRQAAAAVGLSAESGACTKIEKRVRVKSRIAWLQAQDAERLRIKREELEAFWWTAIKTDPAIFFETREEPYLTRKGERVVGMDGKPIMRKVQRLKNLDDLPPEARMMIEGVTYTESGKPNLKVVSKCEANKELRKMLGGDKQPEALGASFIELIMESYRIAEKRDQAEVAT